MNEFPHLEISETLSSLAPLVTELNRRRKEMAACVSEAEIELNALGLGIEVWCASQLPGEHTVGYAKGSSSNGYKWGIYVTGPRRGMMPILEAPWHIKCAAITLIPVLIRDIKGRVERMLMEPEVVRA